MYYKQKEQGIIRDEDIAAVLKPAGIPAEEVKASLPKGVGNIPQITFSGDKVRISFWDLHFETGFRHQLHLKQPTFLLPDAERSSDPEPVESILPDGRTYQLESESFPTSTISYYSGVDEISRFSLRLPSPGSSNLEPTR